MTLFLISAIPMCAFYKDAAKMVRARTVPDMAPERGPVHTCRQSRFPHAPELPCLAIAAGPTMSGKSSLLQRLATEVWIGADGKSCFDRIYVFSPSVGASFEDGIDDTWTPVKRLVETQLIDRQNPTHNAERFFFDDLNAEAMKELERIIDTQFSIIELSRKHGRRQEPQIFDISGRRLG